MEEIVLKAEARTIKGKQVSALRREGKLPAVIYGRGFTPVMITLDLRDSTRIFPRITSSHLVVVDVDGEKHTTLVRERQRHPVSGILQHVDFMEVSLTEKLRASVVIELTGDSPAVRTYNGVIVTGQENLEVECLPRDLPEKIVVDLGRLKNIGDSIYIRDLEISPNVAVLSSLDEMVALVTLPASEGKLAGEGAAFEPEVIEKGKKDEDF